MGCLKSTWDSKLARILRLALFPLGLYLFDVITDLSLAVQYYYSQDFTWFGLTLGFVLGPSIFINIALLMSAVNDGDSGLMFIIKFLLAFLQLAAFPAYFNILHLLMRGKDVKEHVEEKLPIAHLLEAMLESIPQLCLQLYIIISTGEQVSVLKVITMVISLLAAVKAVVTVWYYNITEEKVRTFSCGFVTRVILLTVWKVVELSARVLAVGLFASAFKPWIVLPIGVHWLIMTAMVIWIHDDARTCIGMMLAPPVMAVDIFSMITSMDRKLTFWLNTVLTLLGNITMVTVWHTLKTGQDWYDVPALVGVVVGSVLSVGIGFIEMVLLGNLEFPFTSCCKKTPNTVVPDPAGTSTAPLGYVNELVTSLP